ncbi:hypothetical protein CI109_100533 [Kwoniella shandongensis]|uniref:Uncharacterized protein n=1 Tax=Kwoniella shandongensis TaxID=1734106 RepID=A0A5M6BZH4_9TREE|nr:uncharacterized protein CI109_003546 [Kwoniella shandongensis]KAA5528257.1 hypothetical protein CI109_003546 [Kwoniella shandongensis]
MSIITSLTSDIPSLVPDSVPISIPIFLFLGTAYGIFAPRFKTERQRAYVQAVITSGSMTLISIPYVYIYLRYGVESLFVESQIGWKKDLARFGVMFFGTYLFCECKPNKLHTSNEDITNDDSLITADLAIGYVKYPSQVGLLTGWIHHIVYFALMYYLLNNPRQTPAILLGWFEELPTFDLAISNLFPHVRNDLRFLVTFFILRLVFHTRVLVDWFLPSSRAMMGYAYVPCIAAVLAWILHALWFHSAVKGYLKRRRSASRITRSTTTPSSMDQKTEDPIVDAVSKVDSTIIDSTLPPTPDDVHLVTPRTSSETPDLLASISTLSIPALSETSESLSRTGGKSTRDASL